MEHQYEIQCRVEALAQIAMVSAIETSTFSSSGIHFSHWDSDFFKESNFWLAKGDASASNLNDAIINFYHKLAKLIPRIGLISQCYIEFVFQPFLVKRIDKSSAYFRYTRNSESVGLIFGGDEEKALQVLLANKEIPEAFYHYWNDAVNSIGYSSKLLIMFSAIDALVKGGMSGYAGKTKREKRERLLGPELTNEIFGVQGNTNAGLRNRLVHGEYFNSNDLGKNYVVLVHQGIIQYFNEAILKKELLAESVVDPQRHIWGNREGDEICDGRFIKAIGEKTFDLREVFAEADKNKSGDLENYEYIYDDSTITDY